jgi:LmbE family N-acetylglucosaminyl deacetylase
MQNLMIVAHPDDELLWGYGELKKSPGKWKVVSITNGDNQTRSNSFKKLMKQIGIGEYEIWSFKDTPSRKYAMPTVLKQTLIQLIMSKSWKKIITHNKEGEYGHVQHSALGRFIPDAVRCLKDIGAVKKIKLGYFSFNRKSIPKKNIIFKYNTLNTIYQDQQVIFAGKEGPLLHDMLQHAKVKFYN